MKKLLVLLMTIVMALGISITAYAANTKLLITDASAQCTQMIYLTVSLEDCKKANTMKLAMEYDSTVLTKVASECSWEKKGTLQDFDVAKNKGVWASKKAMDLNGDICTLAFRIKADAPVGDTKVTCEVLVKNDSKVIGTYTATATVTVTCEHSYGEWEQKDDNLHKKVCNYCETEKTAKHVWDEGTVTKQPTETEAGLKVYNCKDCGAEKIEEISLSEGGTSQNPDDSKPEDSKPEDSKPEDSNPSGGDDDSNKPEDSGSSGTSSGNKNPGQSGNSSDSKNPGQSGNLSGNKNPGQSGNLSGNKNPDKSETPSDKQESDKKEPSGTLKEPDQSNSDAFDKGATQEDVQGQETEEHVHTEDDGHIHEEGTDGVTANSMEKYLWISVLAIAAVMLFFGYRMIKKNKK